MPPIQITSINPDPIEQISFLTIPKNSIEPAEFQLPVYKGKVTGLPKNIESIVVTSDLQGVVIIHNETILLGEFLAEQLQLIYSYYFPDIKLKNSIAFLCGDMYANLIKRGQGGNPTYVWEKFSNTFGYTIGIAGNHDHFEDGITHINQLENTTLLTNNVVKIKDITIAGLSGIIGRPDKNFRLDETTYTKALRSLLKKKPDILLTHLSPMIPEKNLLGEILLTTELQNAEKTIMFCGHSHWDIIKPQTISNTTQILNADSKVYILICE